MYTELMTMIKKIEQLGGDPKKELSGVITRLIEESSRSCIRSCSFCSSQRSCKGFIDATSMIQGGFVSENLYTITAINCVDFRVIDDPIFKGRIDTEFHTQREMTNAAVAAEIEGRAIESDYFKAFAKSCGSK